MTGKHKSAVSIFNTHADVEDAVRALRRSQFDMNNLSIAGGDSRSEVSVVGYYNIGDYIRYWGKCGAFWEGVWGTVSDSAFFIIPGIGPVVIGGTMVRWLINTLEDAACGGGPSTVGDALNSIGVPKNSTFKYDNSLAENKYLLVANGTAEEIEKARKILEKTKATDTTVHHS